MSHGWDQDESHVGTSFMVCAPAIEALKEPPRKMDEFILGKQQADGSWEHPGSPQGEEHESKVYPCHHPGELDKLLRAELMSSLNLRQQQDTWVLMGSCQLSQGHCEVLWCQSTRDNKSLPQLCERCSNLTKLGKPEVSGHTPSELLTAILPLS